MPSNELEIPVNTQNRDPRVACVLVADVSGSMSGAPIMELQKGFSTFIDDLQSDPLARKRAEIAVITFGSVARVLVPFQEARDLSPVTFEISGSTNMAAGIDLALDELDARKAQYRSEDLEYFRPWLFLLTDGAPDPDGLDEAVARLNAAEAAKKVTVFAVGVGDNVGWDQLKRLSADRVPVPLKGLAFTEMFAWLSKSLSAVSNSSNHSADGQSTAGGDQQIALPSPQGWAVL